MSIRYSVVSGLALLAAVAPVRAQETLWRIGVFDHASAEFAGRATEQPVVVDAGAKDATRQWPASQAGSLNAHSGPQSHARTIRFRLAAPASGAYVLDLAILAGNPRLPRLELELNGARGTAYLDRHLSYHAEGRADSPICAEARERIPIPASALRQGDNELRITAVDDAADPNGDSQINWDALALLRTGPAPAEPELTLEPSFLFPRENGAVRELLAATLSTAAPVRSGTLTLALAGAEYRAEVPPGRFGQQRFEFLVPEFPPASEAKLALLLDGRTYAHTQRITAKRKFTVYLVPHNHLDIGFTDFQPKIEELQNRNLDRLLEEMRHDPDLRFSLDGVWLVEQYLRTRSPAAQKEFMEQVRAGRISIPAQYANLMAGGAGTETLLRSTYAGRALNRAAGTPNDYANITDVPAYPWGYASVLAAAGVKYFAAGANDDRGPLPLLGRWQTRSPFWWQGPDGAKVLMAYTRQYSQLWFVCGLPPQQAGCRDGLPTFLSTFDSPGYRPDSVLMFGSQLENTDLIPGEGEFVRAWNAKYAWPRLQLATFRDYFETIEKRFGDQLETVRGDFGPYWEDGIGTDAQFAALYRETESRAQSVEKLSSLAALQKPEWAPPLESLRRIWRDLLLYAEHTYTSSGGYSRPESEQSVRQIETKHFHVSDAHEAAHWVAQEAMSRLLESIRIAPPAIAVFNSLAHERGSLVEFDLPNGIQLVDTGTNQAVAVEALKSGNGYRRVRFLAGAVPSLGYRVYRMENAAPSPAPQQPRPANTIENEFFRVTVDPARGGVTSILDKQSGKELVDAKSPYLLNQYLYVAGGDNTRLIRISEHLPTAQLTITGATGTAAATVSTTPWGQSLTYRVSGPHAPQIDVEIRLVRGERKIEIANHLRKEAVNDKEAVYFAFPFAATQPEFEYEGQSGTVNPARDELAGGCREWYAAGHWSRVSGGGISAAVIPLDAPLVSFGDINRGLWPEKFEPKSSTIFSYALNNYWHTNFPRTQSGEFTYRYVITGGATLEPALLSRMGREAMTPLETSELNQNDKVGLRGTLPATPASFLTLSGDGVELEALKPAEDGEGYIVRLLETAGHARKTRLSSSLLAFTRGWLCNAAEDKLRDLPTSRDGVEVDLPAYGIVTVRLLMRPAGNQP